MLIKQKQIQNGFFKMRTRDLTFTVAFCLVIVHELSISQYPAFANETLGLSLGLFLLVSVLPYFKDFLNDEPIPMPPRGIRRSRSPVLFWSMWVFFFVCTLTGITAICWALIQSIGG